MSAAIALASPPPPRRPCRPHHEERAARPQHVLAHVRVQTRLPGGKIGHEERVLVMVAGAAEVGLAEHRDMYRPVRHAGLIEPSARSCVPWESKLGGCAENLELGRKAVNARLGVSSDPRVPCTHENRPVGAGPRRRLFPHPAVSRFARSRRHPRDRVAAPAASTRGAGAARAQGGLSLPRRHSRCARLELHLRERGKW